VCATTRLSCRAVWGAIGVKRRAAIAGKAGALNGVLSAAIGVPLPEAQALILRGGVYVDGRRCEDPGRQVAAGAKLTAVLEEKGGAEPAAAPRLVVLHEDSEVLVVNKPAGLPAQPTPSRTGADLLALATAHLGRPAGLVHRLDKDTTGVTIFGKTKRATTRLAAAFREGRAQKTYLAACGPSLPERGEIDLKLSKDPSRPGRWRASKTANGVKAQTAFVRRGMGDGFAVVDLFPRTGRTHQLRAHLAGIGAPILADALYGGERIAPRPGAALPERCLLHAWKLEIEGRVYEAPVPEDLAVYLAAVARPGGPS
jgi:23S rRNA pseudouridine1911/1915/1917 synthase